MVTSTSTRIGNQYCKSRDGSTSIPTDTKNTAPNKSLTGFTRCSMCSALGASAIREPMMKAPRAAENPMCVARTTIPKHKPMEATIKVSSFIKSFAFLKKVGMRYIPITNHRVKKNAKRPTPIASSIVEMPAAANVESITIIMMPAISSTIKMPKTISVKCLPFSFKSSKALMIMVVELIASIPPKNILSIWLQPKAVPHK